MSEKELSTARADGDDDCTVASHVNLKTKIRIDRAIAERQIPKGDWVLEALLEKLQKEKQ